MELLYPCLLALLGTGFTYCMTTLGAATVFVVRRVQSHTVQDLFLGFCQRRHDSRIGMVVAAASSGAGAGKRTFRPGYRLQPDFVGGVFFYVLDITLPHLNAQHNRSKALAGKLSCLPPSPCITFPRHGSGPCLCFGMAGRARGCRPCRPAALALGIGVQNFPEGSGYCAAAASGGAERAPVVLVREFVGRGGAGGRAADGAFGRVGAVADAVAAFVCGGRDDLCGGG